MKHSGDATYIFTFLTGFFCWGEGFFLRRPEGEYRPCISTLSRLTATAPSYGRSLMGGCLTATVPSKEGAFGVGCCLGGQPTEQASSPSGGGSWHGVPDGRGGCKAMGMVVFCPGRQPTRTGKPPLLHAPSVACGDSLRPATSVGVQTTNRGLYLLRLTTAGR